MPQQIKGKWNNLAKPVTSVPTLEPIVVREEPIIELFDDATRSNIDIHLVQLDALGADPYRCLAVVGEHAIAEVVVTNLLSVDGSLERNLVAQARHSAKRAGRPDPFRSKGTRAIHPAMDEEPANGIVQEVEAKGIESFIGNISDATAAERASRRDRRAPATDWLSDQPFIKREVVEGDE